MTSTSTHTALSKSILKTLLYFDLFQYPLTDAEIFRHLQANHITTDHVNVELERLVEQSVIYRISDFFSISNSLSLGSRRTKGNLLAKESLVRAQKQASFISRFPFVRAVMASGSLSKDYMDESSDLDFFIITKPNRLWIVKFLLALYQKIFLFDSHKYFCVNYLLDESHLEIQEKNIFTATELATLLPLYGKEYYQKLMDANTWLAEYLPNQKMRSVIGVSNYSPSWYKKQLEFLFSFSWADLLENKLRGIFANRLKKRYQKKYSKQDFEIAFKVKEYASKGHPKNHQKKVLELYQLKLDEFGHKMGINWNE